MPDQVMKLPYAQVLAMFGKMEGGMEKLEKAYPGITSPMGYMQHVKTDPSTGAWMLAVPQDVENQIKARELTKRGIVQNQMAMGPRDQLANNPNAPVSEQANLHARPEAKLSKEEMIQKAQLRVGKPEINSPQLQVGKPRIEQLSVGPVTRTEMPSSIPDMSMGPKKDRGP